MGETDSDTECHVKHRIIPRLTPTENNKKLKEENKKERKNNNKEECPKCAERNERKETTEERVERISKTKVTTIDFFATCIDHDMLKLFFGAMLAFFATCAVASLLYVLVVYLFHPTLWNFYFPDPEHSGEFHKEL